MKLTVRHVTRHTFDTPVRMIAHSLRLFPVNNASQRVLAWDVSIEAATWGAFYEDGAGDKIRTVTLAGPVTAYDVKVTGKVETKDTYGVLRGHRESLPPLVWTRTTPLTAPDSAIRKLAERAKGQGLDLAHDLARHAAAGLSYEPGATTAQTSASAALKLGQGVCQDYAHLLIAMAHHRDLPARYVTGYLGALEGEPAHEASHAWAEIWIDGLGFVGFDPANECCPDERHIRLGSGRDAEDAAPIRGSYRGAGLNQIQLDVAVQQTSQ